MPSASSMVSSLRSFREKLRNGDKSSSSEKRRQWFSGCGGKLIETASAPAASKVEPLPEEYAEVQAQMLEDQVKKLRATVERRRQKPGSNTSNDNADAIIQHYEQVAQGLEEQIRQLRAPSLAAVAGGA